jgi:hypothetical protein
LRRILLHAAGAALLFLAAAPPAPAADGFIRDWLLLGSFPQDDAARRLASSFLPDESAAAPKPGDPVEGLAWKPFRSPADTVDLGTDAAGFVHRHNAVAYAFTYLSSPADQDAQLRLGSSNGIAAWLNGERVWTRDGARPLAADQDIVPARLRPGWNLLLVKVVQSVGPWAFTARFTDAGGRPLPDLPCVHQPDAAKPPRPAPPQTVQRLGYEIAAPSVDPEGRVTCELSVRVRNLAPLPVEKAGFALSTGPGAPLDGAVPQEAGPFAAWERKTIRFALPLEAGLALAGAGRPGLGIASGGADGYADFGDDLPLLLLRSLLGPYRVHAWRVLRTDVEDAKQVFYKDETLPARAPGQDVEPEGPAVWLRARLAVPARLEGAPLALSVDRAGTAMRVHVNGAKPEEVAAAPLPLYPPAHEQAKEYVIALRVEPAGTKPVRLPAASFLLAGASAEFCTRNLDVFLALFADARGEVRDRSAKALGALAAGGAREFQAALDGLVTFMQGHARALKDTTLWYVGQSQIDLAGLWRREEALRIIQDTFGQAIQLIEKHPRFTYAQDQAAAYALAEQHFPELFAKVRKAVQERRWSPVGGMWVAPDLVLPSGESLVRQLLYGKRYALDRFGADVTVGWNPLAYGHCAQIPQLLRKSGIVACTLLRGVDGRRLFRWEGLDGSTVLCLAAAPGPPSPDIVSALREGGRPVAIHLQPFGADGHGGGPSEDDVQRVDRLRAREIFPTTDFGTPEEFFPRAAAATPPWCRASSSGRPPARTRRAARSSGPTAAASPSSPTRRPPPPSPTTSACPTTAPASTRRGAPSSSTSSTT